MEKIKQTPKNRLFVTDRINKSSCLHNYQGESSANVEKITHKGHNQPVGRMRENLRHTSRSDFSIHQDQQKAEDHSTMAETRAQDHRKQISGTSMDILHWISSLGRR